MKSCLTKLFCSILAAGALCSAASLAEDKPLTKSDVEAIVKQVITDNPELLIDSVQNYQKKRVVEETEKGAKAIVERKTDILNDPDSPSIGNPKGDVTIVEFFDYHCGYCKQFLPVVTQLTNEDSKLRIVFKEFPILTEDSSLAARAALAVYSIDKSKYLAYHTLLMKSSTAFTEETLTEKAVSLGVDKEAFRQSFADPRWVHELAKNKELASALYITGTPAIIVGDELIPGVIPMKALQQKIAAVRDGKKSQKD